MELPLSQDDIDKINALIEKAYHAGYEMGKQDERRNAEVLQGLRDTVKRIEAQSITVSPIAWPNTQGGGRNGLQPPYKVTC